MRYLVNGQPWTPDEEATGADVFPSGDRLVVRTEFGAKSALVARRGDRTYVSYAGRTFEIKRDTGSRGQSSAGNSGDCRAPMPGQIVDVLVAVGQTVSAGDKLVVLEAMKMQQPVTAPFAGTVTELPVAKGGQVADGDLLVRVSPTTE